MPHARQRATIVAAPGADAAAPFAASGEQGLAPRRGLSRRRGAFVALAMAADCAMILVAYCFSDAAYMTLKLGWSAIWLLNPQLGVFAAVIFGASNVLRHRYVMSEFLNISEQPQRVFAQWNIAFFGATTLAFLSHVIEDSSRGVFLIFYPAALCALYAGRALLVLALRKRARGGALTVSRALVVGFSADIAGVLQRLDPRRDGVRIAGIRVLPNDAEERARDLAEAVAFARDVLPDDIIVAAPWSRADVIDECATAFMKVPAALHLNFAPDCVMARFVAAPEKNRLTLHALQLDAHAISAFGGAMKRALDILAAAIGLALLSPLFLLVAAAIKLDSAGPVFFRQQRYGFNRAPFRIWKFRTMSTLEDGAEVRQATRDDPRISRLGALLRRTNIDELPQLINVLAGEMSLVGPRPHALVHDHAFEPDVPLYARRHNAKPGITGWAQVNGLRGEADTQDKIARRIAHDLYYLDNWSLALDLWIIALTLFSRKAYANAG